MKKETPQSEYQNHCLVLSYCTIESYLQKPQFNQSRVSIKMKIERKKSKEGKEENNKICNLVIHINDTKLHRFICVL